MAALSAMAWALIAVFGIAVIAVVVAAVYSLTRK